MSDQPDVVTLLFIAYQAMKQRLLDAFADSGHEITLAQARLFQWIAPGGSRLSDLAERAGITKQWAGSLVGALESAGYVRRIPDPTDGRARLIQIAPRGQMSIDRAHQAVDDLVAEWTRHLGEEGMRAVTEALVSLEAIIGPARSGVPALKP